MFGNSLGLSFIFCRQCFFIRSQACYCRIQFLNTNIPGSQFCLQFFNALGFGHQFLCQRLNSPLQLGRVVLAVLQHGLQFGNLLFVFFHLLTDELDIRGYLLFSIQRTLCHCTTLQINAAFRCINLAESLRYIIESAHHLIQLGISLSQFH